MLRKRLRLLRGELKKTQLEVSQDLGISRARYTNYETGTRSPDLEILQAMANYYSVSVDYILGKSNIRESKESKKKLLAERLDTILEDNNIVKPGEDLTDEQLEWLMKLVDKAIEMTKLND